MSSQAIVSISQTIFHIINSASPHTVAHQLTRQYKSKPSDMAFSFKDIPQVRPAEIKTYHIVTYDCVSLFNSTFDAKGKTLLITAGGMLSIIVQ